MAPTPIRERRTARVNLLTLPSRRARWDAMAALRGYTLTRLIESAMEREEAELFGGDTRRKEDPR